MTKKDHRRATIRKERRGKIRKPIVLDNDSDADEEENPIRHAGIASSQVAPRGRSSSLDLVNSDVGGHRDAELDGAAEYDFEANFDGDAAFQPLDFSNSDGSVDRSASDIDSVSGAEEHGNSLDEDLMSEEDVETCREGQKLAEEKSFGAPASEGSKTNEIRRRRRDNENPIIAKLLRIQKESMKKDVANLSPHAKRKSRSMIRNLGLDRIGPLLSFKKKWKRYVASLRYDYWENAQAELDDLESVRRGQAAYTGLNIHEGNCKDLNEIWEIECQARLTSGLCTSTFNQLRVFVGQLCRFAVATNLVPAESLYRKGAVYSIMAHDTAIKALFGYFKARCKPGTVHCKATHALKLIRYAYDFFSSRRGGSQLDLGDLKKLEANIQTIQRVNKTVSRAEAAARKDASYRASSGKLLTPEDYEINCSELKKMCDGLETGAKTAVDFASLGQDAQNSVRKYALESKGFVQKWCLHFLNLCIFFGGGQRPQVFTLLERVDILDFRKWHEEVASRRYFGVKISNEKRIRDIDVPHVLFPAAVLRNFMFHIRVILPVIYHMAGIRRGDKRRNYLILHTRTGDVLDTPSVTGTLRRYMKGYDPSFGA